MNNSFKLEEILENYSFHNATYRWVMEGSDILKSIGSDIIKVHFTRSDEKAEWTNEPSRVFLKSVNDYDPVTDTYKLTFQRILDNTGAIGEEEEIRITPHGFSFNQVEKDNWMDRFLPLWQHFGMVEEKIYYNRLETIFPDAPGISISSVEKLKGKEYSLSFDHNIVTVIDSDVEGGWGKGIIVFRVIKFGTITPLSGDRMSVILIDSEDNKFQAVFEAPSEGKIWSEFKINGSYVGKLKLIDLSDPTSSEVEISLITPSNEQ